MAIDIALALFKIRPGEEYGRLGEINNELDYDTLIDWRAPTSKPTFIDIQGILPAVELDLARINKKMEIDTIADERIINNLDEPLSEATKQAIGFLADGLNIDLLPRLNQNVINILGFADKRKRQLNTEDIDTVNTYNPRNDIDFPNPVRSISRL